VGYRVRTHSDLNVPVALPARALLNIIVRPWHLGPFEQSASVVPFLAGVAQPCASWPAARAPRATASSIALSGACHKWMRSNFDALAASPLRYREGREGGRMAPRSGARLLPRALLLAALLDSLTAPSNAREIDIVMSKMRFGG
jgi:hypothetical protein